MLLVFCFVFLSMRSGLDQVNMRNVRTTRRSDVSFCPINMPWDEALFLGRRSFQTQNVTAPAPQYKAFSFTFSSSSNVRTRPNRTTSYRMLDERFPHTTPGFRASWSARLCLHEGALLFRFVSSIRSARQQHIHTQSPNPSHQAMTWYMIPRSFGKPLSELR